MTKIEKDKWSFQSQAERLYRRLSIRECARIQTFPDDYEFVYDKVADGYKMIGNAVPVEFARRLANQILEDVRRADVNLMKAPETGSVKHFDELNELR